MKNALNLIVMVLVLYSQGVIAQCQFFEKGREKRINGRYEEAISILEKNLQEEDCIKRAGVLYEIMLCNIALGRHNLTISMLDSILKIDTMYWVAYEDRASYNYKHGKNLLAVKDYEYITKRGVASSKAFCDYIEILLDLEKYSKMKEVCDNAISIFHHEEEFVYVYYYYRSVAEYQMGRIKEAVSDAELSVVMSKVYKDKSITNASFLILSLCYSEWGTNYNLKLSKKYLKKIDKNFYNKEEYNLYAFSVASYRASDKKIKDYRSIFRNLKKLDKIRLEVPSVEISILKNFMFIDAELYSIANDNLDSLSLKNKDNLNLNCAYVKMYFKMNQYDKVLEYSDKINLRGKNKFETQMMIAWSFFIEKEEKKACEHYRALCSEKCNCNIMFPLLEVDTSELRKVCRCEGSTDVRE